MDQLRYNYISGTNQLDHIYDTVPGVSNANDIATQSAGNYKYDSIGELIGDAASNITNITWTVYGKIASITKSTDTTIKYTYDPAGNRISKTIVHGSDSTVTWYVRDAQGNILSVYTYGDPAVNGGALAQTELDIYGSSRLGIWKRVVPVTNLDSTVHSPFPNSGDSITFTRGNKLFELTNHLGNVLATISDKRYGVTTDDSTVVYYNPEVVSANDYYPFGMLQYARSYAETGSGNYRFGFNGKEKNDEIEGAGNEYDYGMREQDPRTGRFWSVDPLTKNYAELTPYQFGGNSPIKNLDLDGGEPKDYSWNLQNRRFSVNGAKPSYYHIIDDSKLGIIDVEAVYDKITDKTWFIHQGNDGQNYYWKHNPGADQTVRTADNGQWKPYQTGEQAAAVQTEQLTRGISLGFALTIAAPFAVEAMTVTGGGPLWSASIPETFKIGAAKALIGGAGDLMAQKTVNGWDSKVNWYETGISAGASAFGLNPYTGAAALNFVQLDEKSNPVTPFNSNFDFKAYGLNVLLNGASGAAIGAAHLDPTAGLGLSNNAARTGGSTIFNYWGNTLGGVTTNAASAPSQSSANTTNNSSSKSDDKPE